MIEDLFQEKLRAYRPADAVEQEHALAEMMQHYVLAGLAHAGLFREALFHGGTCLRILHGMRRFSEDLNFMLKRPQPDFAWTRYLEPVGELCAREGIALELQDRSEVDGAIKKAFVKTDSIGKVVLIDLPFNRDLRKKIRIKLEIDTNPPAGSGFESAYISFPVLSALTTQTLESGFGTKSHALLCRDYVKGRDWYDLLWYIERGGVPDLPLLERAIEQQGPWAGRGQTVTPSWYLEAMRARVAAVDWRAARADVIRFVRARDREGVELWSEDLFRHQLERLARLL